MLAVRIAAGLIAALALAGAASAQSGSSVFRPLTGELKTMQENGGGSTSARRYEMGVQALQAKNFQAAEAIFNDILLKTPQHAEANLAQGIVKMSLGKWDEAKTVLQIATKKMPKNPDPKSRLGVTLLKLGDRDGAMVQRAGLQELSDKCKNKCRDAQYIAEGLILFDQAAAAPVPAAAPATPAPATTPPAS